MSTKIDMSLPENFAPQAQCYWTVCEGCGKVLIACGVQEERMIFEHGHDPGDCKVISVSVHPENFKYFDVRGTPEPDKFKDFRIVVRTDDE